MNDYHIPVLLSETLEGLNIKPNGIYVDATFGGGGHSKEILARIPHGKLFAFDQDFDAIKNSVSNPNFTFIRSNFRYLENFLRLHKVTQVDGILADFGLSSHHIDVPERGFTFRSPAPLDMRMNTAAELTAADILMKYEPRDLIRIFRDYGEILNAKPVVSRIVNTRETSEFRSNTDLLNSLSGLYPSHKENKFFAQVFQALRIEVNSEIEALEEFLQQCIQVLKPGGRLVLITYHSLEDRPVKNILKTGNVQGDVEKDFYGNLMTPFNVITKKPITPSEEEIENNNRARSAKLRVAEKI